jgi:uncharacterized membrane protein YsdA (DUF1294 family)
MQQLILFYLMLINAVGLLIMLADKQKARANAWRIPEATLMTVAILGGSVGVFLGMRLFRHKTRKPKFTLGVPVILILQVCAAVYFVVK